METNSADGGSLKLELVQDVPRSVTGADLPVTAIEIGSPDTRAPAPTTDPFLAQATRERDAGQVDAALWKRALALAEGNEAAAVAPYLRARSAVLKLALQRKQAQGLVPVAAARPASTESNAPPSARPPLRRARPRALALAVGSVGAVAVATLAWMLLAPGSDAPPASSASPPPTKAAANAPAQTAPQPVPSAASGADAELLAKLASLKQSGNWNVFVIYAAEWTRKAPENAQAWADLASGYVKLGQLDDAYEAAKKAVELDAANPSHLRGLALVYEALERPEDALAAIEKALRLDDRHAESLALAGRLYLQLERLPEARNAFDRALAVDPSSSATSCGALDVARRQGRARDADALAKALKAADIDCPAPSRGSALAAAAVAPGAAAPPRVSAPAARR